MGLKRNNFLDAYKEAKENSVLYKQEFYLLFLPITRKYISSSIKPIFLSTNYLIIKIFYKGY